MNELEITQALVCDAVRLEMGGKVTILGLAGFFPDVGIGVAELNRGVTDFMILLFFKGSAGTHSGTFTVSAPNKKVITSMEISLDVKEKHQAILAINLSGTKIPQVGDYPIKFLYKGKTMFESNFIVKLDPSAAAQPA